MGKMSLKGISIDIESITDSIASVVVSQEGDHFLPLQAVRNLKRAARERAQKCLKGGNKESVPYEQAMTNMESVVLEGGHIQSTRDKMIAFDLTDELSRLMERVERTTSSNME